MLPLHLFADNRDLSAAEYEDIRRGLDTIQQLHFDYRSAVQRLHLDPEVFLPGNIWARLYDFDSFENWTYDLVNMVRCLTPITGFDMLAWGRRDSDDVDVDRLDRVHARIFATGVVPKGFDALLEREFQLISKLHTEYYLIEKHRTLVQNVPERYIARCPDRMGEIGVLHEGAILTADLLTYQARINAMLGGGALARVEQAIAEGGSANVLEIGPGLGFVPFALQRAFDGRLNVFLIDLPRVMARGYAYLAGIVGVDNIGIVTSPEEPPVTRPFVFMPNHLVPAYERHLPPFDLVFNAISLNEMNARQVSFYLDFIAAHLAPTGVFFLEQGAKYVRDHEDALGAACRRFPNHWCCWDTRINGVEVIGAPNSFFYANAPAAATA